MGIGMRRPPSKKIFFKNLFLPLAVIGRRKMNDVPGARSDHQNVADGLEAGGREKAGRIGGQAESSIKISFGELGGNVVEVKSPKKETVGEEKKSFFSPPGASGYAQVCEPAGRHVDQNRCARLTRREGWQGRQKSMPRAYLRVEKNPVRRRDKDMGNGPGWKKKKVLGGRVARYGRHRRRANHFWGVELSSGAALATKREQCRSSNV